MREKEEEREREREKESPAVNIGLLLFYISLCSHSGAAPELSKSRLIDATKPTRASPRRDATRVVCPTFLHNFPARQGGGLVNHTRAVRRGETRRGDANDPLFSRELLAIRGLLLSGTDTHVFFFFFNCHTGFSLLSPCNVTK